MIVTHACKSDHAIMVMKLVTGSLLRALLYATHMTSDYDSRGGGGDLVTGEITGGWQTAADDWMT